jgi:transcriptional regulator with XRE-family HTH domain
MKANLSMESVVKLLADGCNKSSVSRWEQGVLQPTQDRIDKLVKLYGTRSFLIWTEEPPDILGTRNREIYRLHGLKKFTNAAIGKMFGLHRWSVSKIVQEQKKKEGL